MEDSRSRGEDWVRTAMDYRGPCFCDEPSQEALWRGGVLDRCENYRNHRRARRRNRTEGKGRGSFLDQTCLMPTTLTVFKGRSALPNQNGALFYAISFVREACPSLTKVPADAPPLKKPVLSRMKVMDDPKPMKSIEDTPEMKAGFCSTQSTELKCLCLAYT